MDIKKYLEEARRINDLNGWTFPKNGHELFYNDNYFIPTKLCLIHSEVSEALEAFRISDGENFGEEIADIFIRLFDLCSVLVPDIEEQINKKLEKLEKRSFKHGGKRV